MTAPITGWLALGFTIGYYQMLGSDAFIGWVTASQSSTNIQGFSLQSKDYDTSGIIYNQLLEIYNASGSQVNGVTILAFTRDLSQGNNPIPAANITSGAVTAMIVNSQHKTDDAIVEKHTCRSYQGYLVDFQNGAFGYAYKPTTGVRIAHGVLMGTAYAVFFPIGLLFARYGKSGSGIWMKCHWFFQIYASVIGLTGIIIGYTLPVIQFETGWHGQLGTVIFILTFIQVFMGLTRPHKVPGEDPTTPRLIFEVVHVNLGKIILLMAIAQIVAGIQELGTPPWSYGIWAPFPGMFFIIAIILEIRMWTVRKD